MGGMGEEEIVINVVDSLLIHLNISDFDARLFRKF